MSLLTSAPGQSVSSRAWASSSLCILQVLLVLLQCGHLFRKQTNKKVRTSVNQSGGLNQHHCLQLQSSAEAMASKAKGEYKQGQADTFSS